MNIEEDIKFNYNFKEFKNHLDIKKSTKKRAKKVEYTGINIDNIQQSRL